MLLVCAWFGWREYQRLLREEPERFPWTPLSLADPIGPFTGRKLAALGEERERCEDLLAAIGNAGRPTPPRRLSEPACGFDDGMELRPENRDSLRYVPVRLITACPVAAALALWEREVVQPAALRHYGQRVAGVDHFGSFSCRRLYGRSDGAWSEHATADAVDIAGFRLADGRRIIVLRDWNSSDAAFLQAVRDGACKLFATVLSPDYNAAHADHLHFDQAARGATGWRGCS
ncbi:MAG TPA: extensin family protein [Sphingomicrobium sp.]|nr:extensin family protein [Sphingomicrobium sp.]